MNLAELKLTVARTTGAGIPTGTAFLVSPTHALTCAHCVVDTTGAVVDAVDLLFSQWGQTTTAAVDLCDRERDVALLRLREPLGVSAGQRSRMPMNGAQWQAFGYPAASGERGLVIGGDVVDNDARTGQSVARHVMQLRCHEAGDEVHGVSGSPVFVDGVIVGMITNQAKKWGKPSADGRREAEPTFGALFALSMAHIASASKISATIDWNFAEAAGAGTGDGEPGEEELFLHYRRIVESSPKLSSAKVPGRHGSIETVPLESIYVEHEVRGLATLDDIWQRHRVAVLGEDGLGKSAFLKHLNLRLLDETGPAEGARLWPLHVELDRFAQQTKHEELVEFAIEDTLRGDQQAPLRAMLRRCNSEQRLVLFCDGLEKVHANYERVIDELSRQPRFVATIRPESRTDIGQEAGGTLRLEPFDQRRINLFVERWVQAVAADSPDVDASRILREISSQPSLLELAGIARFLGLMCALISSGQTVVARRTAVVAAAWLSVCESAFTSLPFARQTLGLQAIQRLAYRAFAGQTAGDSEFEKAELYEALADLREQDPDEIVALLLQHEIIVPGSGSGYPSRSFRFPVQTFQDYLAAEQLSGDSAFLKELSALRLDSRWARLLPLLACILGKDRKRLPALRSFLETLSALQTGEVLGLHWCLVAECLAEVNPDLLPQLAPVPQKVGTELLRVWNDQPSVRGRVAPWIRRLQPPEFRRGLDDILADSSASMERRGGAAFALSAFRDPAALDTLVMIAEKDPVPGVRTAACLGLAFSKAPAALNAIVGRLRDTDLAVRQMAGRCIARRRDRELAEPVIAAWLDGLHSTPSDPFFRVISNLAWSLAILSVRPEATVPVLLDSLEPDRPNEAQFAAAVLGQAGVRGAAWPGIQLLEAPNNDPLTTQAAAQMLAMLGTEASMAALRAAFARADQAAKSGVFAAFSAIETVRTSPAAELLLDATDTSITWSIVRPIEAEMFEAQAASNLLLLDSLIAAQGREALLAEFRAALEKEFTPLASADTLAEFARVFAPDADDLERVAAFESLQLLEPNSERLVKGLFDRDSRVALRAAGWIRVRHHDVPVLELLAHLDQVPMSAFNFGYVAAITALARLEYLPALIEHKRTGSRAAAEALWTLSSQFGFRVYEDGRVELPDGQVEPDALSAAERLQTLEAASARPRTADDSASAVLEAARAEHAAAQDAKPQDAAGFACRGILQALLGQLDEAFAAFDAAIELDPTNPLWRRLRGLIHLDHSDFANAASDLAQAISLGDRRAMAHRELGRALYLGDQVEEAITAYTTALSIDPNVPEAAEALEEARAALGKPRAGTIRILQPAAEEDWSACLLRARHHLSAGELDKAFTETKRVIVAHPLHPEARVLRARVWVEQEALEFAIFDLRGLVTHSPEASDRDAIDAALVELLEISGGVPPRELTGRMRADALGARGVVLAALGRWDRAIADLEEAVATGADNWMILNALGWLYADHLKINFEHAAELAERALAAFATALIPSDDDRAVILLTQGVAYMGRGLHKEAATALEQASLLAPSNPDIVARLELAKGRGV